MYKLDRRPPPVPDRRRVGENHHPVTYIGEGLIEPNGVDSLDPLSEDDIDDQSPRHRRKLLDSLAIDVGEKYLDDIYRREGDEDDCTSGEDDSDDPQSGNYRSSISGNGIPAVVKPRTDKEQAWLKVRKLLIEEEEKASTRKKSVDSHEEYGIDCYGTVKLLDSLVRSGSDYNGSVSSEGSTPKVDPSLAPTPASSTGSATTFSRMGYKMAQFLQGAYPQPGSPFPYAQQPLTPGKSSAQTAMMAMLGQITAACQRTELSEAAVARISTHVASIDRIVREELISQQKIEARRLSSTQRSNDSSDYDFRVPTYPLGKLHARVAPTVRESFKAFTSAEDLMDTMAAFDRLIGDCGLSGVQVEEPWYVYYHIRAAVYSKLGFRQKQLFKLLDARFNTDVYKRRPAANKRVCIVGAGPVGLRAAVELALLGSHVSVLEKRTKFNRENMLHLWPWVVQDLASLGAKVLFRHFCRSRTYFHVSTRQLQVVLLKVALLVGVQVHTSTGFEAIVPPGSEQSGENPFYSIKSQPQISVEEFTAVLGATGVNDQVADFAGINRFVFNQKESLGIVCYFPNLETTEETKVREFSWTAQLKHQMLYKMRDVGLDLENIVYFRGEMHYLVMTPKRHNLLTRGVVKKNHPNSADLVRDGNINHNALHAFANAIVKFAGIPRKTDFTRVSLFDFSSLTRAEKAASILTSHGKKLYVGLIGDSLLEPVWHEGVGTCRGFLGALDGVWMVAQIGLKADKQLLAERETAYKVMQRLSGHHRDEMQKNVRKYTVDPRSRYTIDFPRGI
ncbi:methionine sulfoxide oxidase mical1 protein [Phytophthora cinnamomi]|uniref:methionine sulfoxide oxidase mical1 protein n=1 Tax=Phytophthora cinnamomi TaxID=4785 RepID=UPI003559C1D6|nr:methionine sulfoxide oxidase mical1 protein [Phytophthora cinnamomi]